MNTLAILMFRTIGMGFAVVTPAIFLFVQHFTETEPELVGVLPVTLISTLPTLFTVIGIAIAGITMGRFLKYRTLAVIASGLF